MGNQGSWPRGELTSWWGGASGSGLSVSSKSSEKNETLNRRGETKWGPETRARQSFFRTLTPKKGGEVE